MPPNSALRAPVRPPGAQEGIPPAAEGRGDSLPKCEFCLFPGNTRLTKARNDDILALEKRECQQSEWVSANMSISERKKKILAAVVDEYIRTAEPVGSKHLAESAGLGCSSATIRNELAELVALGYLEQPHTSAGRVPTPMGYRMYVNELMQKQKYSLEET